MNSGFCQLSPVAIGLVMFGGMLLLMAVRIPIAAAMFVPGALGYWALTNEAAMFNLLKGSAVARLTVYELSVIPLFLLMGQFATQGGLSRALFRCSLGRSWVMSTADWRWRRCCQQARSAQSVVRLWLPRPRSLRSPIRR